MEARLQDVKPAVLCGAEGPSIITEGLFLRNQEATAAVQLLQENRKDEQLLQGSAQHHQQLQQRQQRLKEELEKHGVQVPAQTQSLQGQGAALEEVAIPKRGSS